MWSLTSQRERRASGPENFQSQAEKDFFNTIGTKRTCGAARQCPFLEAKQTLSKKHRPVSRNASNRRRSTPSRCPHLVGALRRSLEQLSSRQFQRRRC